MKQNAVCVAAAVGGCSAWAEGATRMPELSPHEGLTGSCLACCNCRRARMAWSCRGRSWTIFWQHRCARQPACPTGTERAAAAPARSSTPFCDRGPSPHDGNVDHSVYRGLPASLILVLTS